MSLLVVFGFAYISDKANMLGATVIAAQSCYLLALVIARQVHPHVGQWSRWGLWTLVNSFAVGYHPVHNTWVQLNCRTPGEPSVSIACVSPPLWYPCFARCLQGIPDVDGEQDVGHVGHQRSHGWDAVLPGQRPALVSDFGNGRSRPS